jgi:hypothetical protein
MDNNAPSQQAEKPVEASVARSDFIWAPPLRTGKTIPFFNEADILAASTGPIINDVSAETALGFIMGSHEFVGGTKASEQSAAEDE